MTAIVRRMPWPEGPQRNAELLVNREWLVSNGLGGYAGGSIAGVVTRRYHGLLIAALPAPFGRTVMLRHLAEELHLDGRPVAALTGEERLGSVLELRVTEFLTEFRLEDGLPVWRHDVDDTVLEKRVVLPHMQNTVHVSYRMLSGGRRGRLLLRPSLHIRPHDAPVGRAAPARHVLTAVDGRFEITADDLPPLRLRLDGGSAAGTFTVDPHCVRWRPASPATNPETTETCAPAMRPTTRGRSGPG